MYGNNNSNSNNNDNNMNEASHLYPQSEVETDDDVFIMTQRPTTTTNNTRRRSSVSSLPDPTTITASMSTLGTSTTTTTTITTMLRRSSLASTGTITSQQSISSVVGNGTMTEEEQEERRRNIKAIMSDKTLTQKEKSKKIQSLMDGRGQQQQQPQFYSNNNSQHTSSNSNRRGSMGSYCSTASSVYASSMAQAAADAVCETIILYQQQNLNRNQQQQQQQHHDYPSNNAYNPNHERSFHTTQSCSYSYDDDEDEDDDNNEMTKMGTSSTTKPSPTGVDPQVLGSYRQYHGRSKSLQDWTDSDRVTVAAQTTVFGTNNNQNKIQLVSRLMEQSRPACEHYERNCTVVSPCCGLAFGCRICHDECPALPPPIVFRHLELQQQQQQHLPVRDSDISSTSAAIQNATTTTATATATTATTQLVRHTNKLERRRSLPTEFRTKEDDHHLIDRFAIVEVICRHCYTRQSSKTNKCISCSIVFGEYHCNICNLWMSDVESPYHCEDCGFCRVGGRNNFRHCNDCGMCIDTLLFEDHNCKSGKYMSNCPICQEDLFSSRFASHEMPCGHAIHWHCFTELTTYDSRCPVCKKTVESPERMEANWNAIAVGIALQPVPPEMARMVNILCNDCETITNNLRWHFLGVRCKHCFSFNTIVEQVVLQGRDAASYLDRLEYKNATQHQQQHNMGGVPTDISLPTRFIGLHNDLNIRNDDDSSDDTMSEEDGMEE